MSAITLPIEVIEKFWSLVEKTDYCWNWLGRTSNGSYPLFKVKTKTYTARQTSLTIAGKSEGKDSQPYLCKNVLCVNPDHLSYTPSTEERFWSFVNKTDTCWLWTGHIAKKGYPKFCLSWKPYVIATAHHYSYELQNGPVKSYERIRHTCGNGACVNPAHLHIPTTEELFWEKVQKLDEANGGCWIWTAAHDKNGYGLFSPSKTIGQMRATHYSWQLYIGRAVPNCLMICHYCDHPACVNPHHLWLGTNADNMQDMAKKGRASQGEDHPKNKLTVEDVIFIRNSPLGLSELGRQLGVSPNTILCIRRGTIWKSVPLSPTETDPLLGAMNAEPKALG